MFHLETQSEALLETFRCVSQAIRNKINNISLSLWRKVIKDFLLKVNKFQLRCSSVEFIKNS